MTKLKVVLFFGFLFSVTTVTATTTDLPIKEQANLAFTQGDYQHANLHYRRALRDNPNDSDLLIGIAKSEEILGRNAVALQFALKAKKIDAANLDVYLILGRLYAVQKRWIDSRIAYQVARLLDPNNSGAMLGLGQAIENVGDSEGANDQYKAFETNQKTTNK